MNEPPQLKKFEFYHTGSAESVKSVLIKLADFIVEKGLVESADRNPTLWRLIYEMGQDFKDKNNIDPNAVLLDKIISLVELPVVERMSAALEAWLSNDLSVVSEWKDAADRVYTLEVYKQEILKTQLPEKLIQKLVSEYDLLEPSQKIVVNQQLTVLLEYIALVDYQLRLVASFLRYDRSLLVYSAQEIDALLNNQADLAKYDAPRFVYSLREYMDYGDGGGVIVMIYDFLRIKQVYENKEYLWEDSFVLVIFLHFIFHFFPHIDELRQRFWLSHYFVRALVAGVPLRDVLEKELYNTKNLPEYINFDTLYFVSVNENQEELSLDDEKSFVVCITIKNFIARLGDKISDAYQREKIIDDFVVNSPIKKVLKVVLRDALHIFIHLKNADLVDKNRGSEATVTELSYNQLVHLLTWWLDEDFWSLIGDFFTNTDEKFPKFISLSRLLTEIKTNVNLDDQAVIDKLIRFGQFLKDRGVVGSETDLVHFDEKTGKFHWNEEAFK